MNQFLILVIHTISLWFLVLLLHKYRSKITILPLYGLIAALTILTHTLSTAGSHVIFWDTFLLISSTAYFTPIMIGIYLLYIFDTPAAARKALQIVVGVSLLHILTVFIVDKETTEAKWIPSLFPVYKDYFFSVLAIIFDVAIIGIGWEFIGRLKSKFKIENLFILVSLLMFIVFVVDSFIFDTGVFFNTPSYWTILSSNIMVRFILSVVLGFVISRYMGDLNFSESARIKPANFWEIINFSTEAEKQIIDLQEDLKKREDLTKQLEEAKEIYRTMLSGINMGVYQINFLTHKELWSDMLYILLGYKVGEVEPSFERFLSFIHEEDRISLLKDAGMSEIEVRILSKGSYKWYKFTRVRKFDRNGRKTEEVGSIVDIDTRKKFESQLNDKLATLDKINKIMVNREIQLIQMKRDLKELNKQLEVYKSKEASSTKIAI